MTAAVITLVASLVSIGAGCWVARRDEKRRQQSIDDCITNRYREPVVVTRSWS